jgi:hypothetical protein
MSATVTIGRQREFVAQFATPLLAPVAALACAYPYSSYEFA